MKSLVDQWLTVLTKAVCAQLQATSVCGFHKGTRAELKLKSDSEKDNVIEVLQNCFHERAALVTLRPNGH